MGWVLDLLRMILGLLDRAVYALIGFFYKTLLTISNVELFKDETLGKFASRVYTFLALIMVFKVVFSIINYIINPDNFNNNEKGVGKLIQNIVIVLILIVTVPQIFTQALNLQHIILEENVIGKIILGTSGTNSKISLDSDDGTYRAMGYSVLQAFLKPNTNLNRLREDENGILECQNRDGRWIKYKGAENGIISQTTNNEFIMCLNDMSDYTTSLLNIQTEKYDLKAGFGLAYVYSVETSDYMGLISMVNAKHNINAGNDNNEYMLSYTPIISTIAGGFVAWILLIFCFDIAIRTVKMSFLQLIAPIPIISYIDPKSGKNGMFQKWVKTASSTYADLFIRLIAIYFAIYIVKLIGTNGELTLYGGGKPNFIVQAFIIIGALLFAKQIPKLIEDITGINLSGKFELNPMKKLGESPFAAAAIGGIGGAIGGMGANIASGIINKNGFGNTFRSALGGLGSGLVRGGHAGLSGKGKDNAWKAVTTGLKGTVDARNLRAKRIANGDGGIEGWARRRGVDLSNAAGIESGASKFEHELAAYSEIQNQADSILAMAEKEMVKENDNLKFNDSHGNQISMSDFKARQEELKLLQGMNTSGWSDADIKAHAKKISELNADISITTKRAAQAWVDAAMNGQIRESDGSIKVAAATAASNIEALQDAVSRSSYSKISSQPTSSGRDIKHLKDEMARVQAEVKATDEYRQAQVNKKNDSNK